MLLELYKCRLQPPANAMRGLLCGLLLAAAVPASGQEVKLTSVCDMEDCDNNDQALRIGINWGTVPLGGCHYGVGPSSIIVTPPSPTAGGKAPAPTNCPETTLSGTPGSLWPGGDSLMNSGFRAAEADCDPWVNAVAKQNEITFVDVKLNMFMEQDGAKIPECSPNGFFDVYDRAMRMSFYSSDCTVHACIGSQLLCMLEWGCS